MEPEGQGQRIIMGVTRLLLLGLFYTIQMQIYVYYFAHDCKNHNKQILKWCWKLLQSFWTSHLQMMNGLIEPLF